MSLLNSVNWKACETNDYCVRVRVRVRVCACVCVRACVCVCVCVLCLPGATRESCVYSLKSLQLTTPTVPRRVQRLAS